MHLLILPVIDCVLNQIMKFHRIINSICHTIRYDTIQRCIGEVAPLCNSFCIKSSRELIFSINRAFRKIIWTSNKYYDVYTNVHQLYGFEWRSLIPYHQPQGQQEQQEQKGWSTDRHFDVSELHTQWLRSLTAISSLAEREFKHSMELHYPGDGFSLCYVAGKQ